MAQIRQRNTVPRPRPLSADFLTYPKEASMLYSILPSAVQSRIPRLPSLRRSVSIYGLSKFADSRASSIGSSTSGTRTPDGAYTSAMVLSDRQAMAEEDMAGYYAESVGTSEDEALQTKASRERQPQRVDMTENASGIGWKFANQGMSLLT